MTEPELKTPEENVAVTAAKGVSILMKIFSVLEKASIALFMMFMERAKIKQEKAEDKEKKAESDNTILKKNIELDKEADEKSDAEVINDFLSEQSGDNSGQGTGSR